MSNVTLYHGDCLEQLGKVADGSVDLILSDPPFGTTACKWDTIIPFEPLWKHYKRVLKKGGAVLLSAAQPFTSVLVMSNPEWFRYELIFEKTRAIGFLYAKQRPLACHENVIVFAEGWTTYNPQMTPGKPFSRGYCKGFDVEVLHNGSKVKAQKRKDNETGDRLPRSVMTFSNADAEGKPIHPTQKSVAMMTYLTNTYSNPGETVLDNCFGSGSTGVACVYAKRKFIGIEKDSEYFQKGSARITEAVETMESFIL
jgi:hypothetical protein